MPTSQITSRDLSWVGVCNMVQQSCSSGMHLHIRDTAYRNNELHFENCCVVMGKTSVQSNPVPVLCNSKRSVSQARSYQPCRTRVAHHTS